MVKYGIRVREIMERKVITAKSTDSIRRVSSILKKHDRNGLVVVDSGKPVGVVTLKDIVFKAIVGKVDLNSPISKIMSKPVITIEPDEDIGVAIKLMKKHKIKRLPVLEGGELVGYLTESDLSEIEPGLLDVLMEKLKILQPSFKFKIFRR